MEKLKGAAADTGHSLAESRDDRHRCDSQPFQLRKGQTAGAGDCGTEKGELRTRDEKPEPPEQPAYSKRPKRKGTGSHTQGSQNRRRKTEADNQPVPLYGKRQREHRGTPGNGCPRQRYPAPAHRRRDNLFRIPVRPRTQKKAPGQEREDKHC